MGIFESLLLLAGLLFAGLLLLLWFPIRIELRKQPDGFHASVHYLRWTLWRLEDEEPEASQETPPKTTPPTPPPHTSKSAPRGPVQASAHQAPTTSDSTTQTILEAGPSQDDVDDAEDSKRLGHMALQTTWLKACGKALWRMLPTTLRLIRIQKVHIVGGDNDPMANVQYHALWGAISPLIPGSERVTWDCIWDPSVRPRWPLLEGVFIHRLIWWLPWLINLLWRFPWWATYKAWKRAGRPDFESTLGPWELRLKKWSKILLDASDAL